MLIERFGPIDTRWTVDKLVRHCEAAVAVSGGVWIWGEGSTARRMLKATMHALGEAGLDARIPIERSDDRSLINPNQRLELMASPPGSEATFAWYGESPVPTPTEPLIA